MMYSKDSKNYFAIAPGTLISEVMENKGISSHEVARRIHLTDQEFDELLEGNNDLTDKLAESLAEVLNISKSWILSFEAKYHKDIEVVNKENAVLILEPA